MRTDFYIHDLLFLIYIKDIPDGLNSYVNIFADDAKLMKQIRNADRYKEFPQDNLYMWSKFWKNAKKKKKAMSWPQGLVKTDQDESKQWDKK